MIRIGNPRLDFYTVTSTLDIARVYAERSAPHGTLITASHQTAGRGRRGARWHDDSGASALMTFILRPGTSLEEAWRIPFIASLAGVRLLRAIGFETALVKWPNDLVIEGCKVGGLLVEAVSCPETSGGGKETSYLLGVGINVSLEDFGDPIGFQIPPTSLALSGRNSAKAPKYNAADIIDDYTPALDRVWTEHISSGPALIDAWRAYQLTGQDQRGVDLETGLEVIGVYQDVRFSDGAGLLEVVGRDAFVAIMPAAA